VGSSIGSSVGSSAGSSVGSAAGATVGVGVSAHAANNKITIANKTKSRDFFIILLSS
jgi:hypothetical protein